MPTFDDLILYVTAHIIHDTDFDFKSNRGQLANNLRERILGEALPGLPLELKGIQIDDEGDIAIQTQEGSVYFTPPSVFITGWIVTPRDLSEGRRIRELSDLLETLFKMRGSLRPLTYQVRIFFSARFLLRSNPQPILSRCSDATLKSFLGDRAPSAVNTFRASSEYQVDPFSDSLEIEATSTSVHVRYKREASADIFDSCQAFLSRSNLIGLVDDLRPFLSDIVADPRKLVGRVFKPIS